MLHHDKALRTATVGHDSHLKLLRLPRQHHGHHTTAAKQDSSEAPEKGVTANCGDMNMLFHGGNSETLLFDFWRIENTLALTLSCLLVFIVAVLYEGLKFYRQWLYRTPKRRAEGGVNNDTANSSEPRPKVQAWSFQRQPTTESEVDSKEPGYKRWIRPMHFFQTVLHMIQVTISFMLMLVFMSFNVWLCLAVVLGAGLGYYIFHSKGISSMMDHCT